MHFVKETSDGLVFPRNIPQKRGNRGFWFQLGSILLSLLYCSCNSAKNGYLHFFTPVMTIIVLTTVKETIIRTCHLFEELKHKNSRYNSSKLKIVRDTFHMPWIYSAMAVIYLTLVYQLDSISLQKLLFDSNQSSSMFCISALMCQNIIFFNKSPLNESLQINNLEGIDYGSGMAHSFFYGYLRIVLPRKGNSEKGLTEFLQDYESKNRVFFEVPKLFILIPLSLHCPPRLDSTFSISIEHSRELEQKLLDVAGVSNRSYKNSVYKINMPNKTKKYICAEYATPIKTLYEVTRQNTKYANLYLRHRKEFVLNFYLTLRELVASDPDCCNLCELIFYDDKDENGEYRDAGEIILERMTQLSEKVK